jgi:carbamoyltransferase
MKFLSYHVWPYETPPPTIRRYAAHDSNISYFDGKTIRYFKSERMFQIKHHKLSVNDCDDITKKIWGVSRDDVDDVIFVSADSNTVEPQSNFKNLIKHIYCESTDGTKFIDHHYAHALSVSLLEDVDISINIDGKGSLKSWSVYRGEQFLDCGYIDIAGSIGFSLTHIGHKLNIKGDDIDLAGKLMGAQSYGNIDNELLKLLRKYDIYNINPVMYTFEGYTKKLNWLRTVHERYGEMVLELFEKYAKPNERIGYSGGVAQNVIWNSKLKEKYPNLVVMPYSGDEGLSLGGMEFLRRKHNLSRLSMSNFPFCQSDESPPSECLQLDRVVNALANGKIVAWYQGNGEIGPRALGNRSILMDPRIVNGKDKINRVKNRESFRPFGSSILAEFAKEYFDVDYENPYMLYVGKVQKDNLSSITHVDGTCRFQTVTTGQFRQLLEKFYELTNCPVLLNTSLNNAGNPIAAFSANALYEYETNAIDMLVIGNEVYER